MKLVSELFSKINKIINKYLCLLIVIALTITMSGCFPDLDYESEDAYCDSFGNVYMLEKDISDSHKYGFKGDFYYEDIGDELHAAMDCDTYSYLYFKFEEDINVDEIYMFVRGEQTATLQVDIMVVNNCNVHRKYDDGYTRPEGVDDPYAAHKAFSDPEPLKSKSASVTKTWDSFGFDLSGKVVKKDQYILFRFVNNTAYGKDEGLEPVSFQATGIIVSKSK